MSSGRFTDQYLYIIGIVESHWKVLDLSSNQRQEINNRYADNAGILSPDAIVPHLGDWVSSNESVSVSWKNRPINVYALVSDETRFYSSCG